MKKLFIFLLCCISFASVAAASQQIPLTLATAQKKVAAELLRLDRTLKKAADELGKSGIAGDDARKILAETCSQFSSAVDCSTVDPHGRMVTVEPTHYRNFEGKDISGQEHIRQLLKSHKPVLSPVFRSVEGYAAVDSEYPVFDQKGTYIGSVSIMFKQEKFLADIIEPLVKGLPLDIWIMEKGGRILYDADPSQIGLNLFTSQEYQPFEQLIKLGHEIAKTDQGSGVYNYKAYLTNRIVTKKAYWQTASLYGTDWRLIAIHLEPKAGEEKTVQPASIAAAGQMLEKLVSQTALQTALASGTPKEALNLFKSMYEATPGIYSIQWVDIKGINRFGYPEEHSLSGYNFNLRKATGDNKILQILAKQKPGSYEAPLFEEKIGRFVSRPVFNGSQYLGLVYSITLK